MLHLILNLIRYTTYTCVLFQIEINNIGNTGCVILHIKTLNTIIETMFGQLTSRLMWKVHIIILNLCKITISHDERLWC